MKRGLLFFILFCFLGLIEGYAQEKSYKDLDNNVQELIRQQKKSNIEIKRLRKIVTSLERQNLRNLRVMDSLKAEVWNLQNGLTTANKQFSEKIVTTNNDLAQIKEESQKSFQQHFFYICAGVLFTLIVVFLLYALLRKRISSGSNTIDEIRKVQNRLQEESLQLDNKLLSLIEKESLLTREQEDHSLAMKVADEVVRIEMNLYRMDKNIKGYKQLSKAVERIKNNFIAQGYELIDMLGMAYDEGMRINADFIMDESLPEGSRIITSVTKPQINYHGQMIQKAIVTVSQNI